MPDESPSPTAAASPERAVVFRWDLDKTYLQTEFESFRQLVRIPFESAADKVHLPGVPHLIRGLRKSAVERGERPYVFFLSASPPQIGNAIREKLELDGVEYDGITFKDQLRNLMRGRFKSLREQIGYKLGELLESRLRLPPGAREVLFGDDWESDPLIYSLYADVLAGTLETEHLRGLLAELGVARAALARIETAAGEIASTEPSPAVLRIYINLERRTPGGFQAYGPRLVPAFNYLQTAASLHELGLLDLAGLIDTARALIEQGDARADRLRNSLDDLVRRGHLRPESALRIVRELGRAGLSTPGPGERRLRERLKAAFDRLRRRARARKSAARSAEPVTPSIDYDAIVREHAARH